MLNDLCSRGASGRFLLATICLVAAALTAQPAVSQEWKPSRNVDFIVSSGAGGAADREAREIQKFLQVVPGIPSVSVTNRPGGAGAVAWTYLSQRAGDAHYLATLNVALLTNQILGVTPLRYQDLTPLAILMREYVAVWTRTESQIASTKDLLARLKKDPASVSFGISPARGNQNHIVLGMLANAAGVDPRLLKIVVYAGGGTGTTAALGGHVDVWAGTLGGALTNAEARTIRVLGISSEQRQPGRSAALPTFREQGIDAVYSAFRGVIAPGGLSAGQRAYWDQTFATMTKNPEWKKLQDEHAWGLEYRNSAETRKVLDAEYDTLRKVLANLGVAKSDVVTK